MRGPRVPVSVWLAFGSRFSTVVLLAFETAPRSCGSAYALAPPRSAAADPLRCRAAMVFTYLLYYLLRGGRPASIEVCEERRSSCSWEPRGRMPAAPMTAEYRARARDEVEVRRDFSSTDFALCGGRPWRGLDITRLDFSTSRQNGTPFGAPASARSALLSNREKLGMDQVFVV